MGVTHHFTFRTRTDFLIPFIAIIIFITIGTSHFYSLLRRAHHNYTAMNWASGATIGCAISSDTGTYQNNPVNYYYGAPSEIKLPNVNPTESNLNSQVLYTEPLEV